MFGFFLGMALAFGSIIGFFVAICREQARWVKVSWASLYLAGLVLMMVEGLVLLS